MIKNIIIAVLVLFSISLTAMVYANDKEREELVLLAERFMDIAERNAEMARYEEQKAVEAAAKARIAERKAIQLMKKMKDCQ